MAGDLDESAEHDLVYLGLVGIIDPPRAEAAVAVGEAHRAGIRTIMITGDHPVTARRIASDLGIVGPDARAITGAELDRLTDEEFRASRPGGVGLRSRRPRAQAAHRRRPAG